MTRAFWLAVALVALMTCSALTPWQDGGGSWPGALAAGGVTLLAGLAALPHEWQWRAIVAAAMVSGFAAMVVVGVYVAPLLGGK